MSYNPDMPDFRLLGPLEIAADDGTPITLAGTKQRAVLTVLLLRAGEVVSQDFLVDAVWGEDAPRTATTSLQNSISALRRLLGPDLLVTRPPGYALTVDKDSIDLCRFERLVREARAAERDARPSLLREALGLWRGEPLAEVAFEPFALAEVRRLEELRLGVLEECVDAELEAGYASRLVPEL